MTSHLGPKMSNVQTSFHWLMCLFACLLAGCGGLVNSNAPDEAPPRAYSPTVVVNNNQKPSLEPFRDEWETENVQALSGQNFMELQESAGKLNLNEDFTIEVCFRWQGDVFEEVGGVQYLCGDEAWRFMHESVEADRSVGWVLRVHPGEASETASMKVDFTVAAEDSNWISVVSPEVAYDQGWHRIAARRKGDVLQVFLNGEVVGETTIAEPLVASHTPVYIGPVRHALENRRFDGEISWLNLANKAIDVQPASPAEFPQPDDDTVAFVLCDEGKLPLDMSRHKHRVLMNGAELVGRDPAPLAPFRHWYQDLEAAKEKAAAQGKDLFIAFDGSDWCGWSVRMAETVYQHPYFLRYASSRYVLVFVDFPKGDYAISNVHNAERNDELARYYEISGFPQVVLADAQGRPYGYEGFSETPAEFTQQLTQWQELKKERDAALAAVQQAESAAEKLEAVRGAASRLLQMNVARFYPQLASQWNEIVSQHDPSNEQGVSELVLLLQIQSDLKQVQDKNPLQLRSIAERVTSWKETHEFQDRNHAAGAHLWAARCLLLADDAEAARGHIEAGMEFKPDEFGILASLSLLDLQFGEEKDFVAGTAFVVSSQGHLLTNDHVIDDIDNIGVQFDSDDEILNAKVVARDRIHDMAILQIDASARKLQPLAISSAEPRRGQGVAAFGFPGGSVLQLTRGIISSQTAQGMLQLDCLINPGNSGGPLCGRDGTVAGMVTAKSVSAFGVDSYGFAIPSSQLTEFLSKHSVKVATAETEDERLDWDEVDAIVSPGVAMIIAR